MMAAASDDVEVSDDKNDVNGKSKEQVENNDIDYKYNVPYDLGDN